VVELVLCVCVRGVLCCPCVITMLIVSSAVRTGSHPKRWQQQQQSILVAFCVRRGEMERKTCVQPRARARSMQAS